MKSVVSKVNVIITPTIRVLSDHIRIYPYGQDHTRMVQILIWSGSNSYRTIKEIQTDIEILVGSSSSMF